MFSNTPAALTHTATLTAAQAGPVSYLWVYSSGKPRAVQTAQFASAGARQVAGGVVRACATGTGWAEVQVSSPLTLTSNKAVCRFTCTKHADQVAGISAAASVTPAARTVTCGTAPPSFTFTGSITSTEAATVGYYWMLGNGTGTLPATVSFPAAGTMAVQATTFTRPATAMTGQQ